MAQITYHHPDGRIVTVEVEPGTSVMRAALMNGVRGIVGQCGGQLICATCHVYVHEEFLDELPPPSGDEEDMLEETIAPRDEVRSRLGCQIKMGPHFDRIEVDIPEEQ